MIVDLGALAGSQKSFDFKIEPGEIDLEAGEAILSRDLAVSSVIKRGVAQTDIAGKILAGVEIDCSRCLQKTKVSLEIPFEVGFVTAEHYPSEKEVEITEDDLNISVLSDEKIDFTELIREQILLALPTQTLCREDCQGLCRICGGNKNLVNCNCEEEETDPRWAALKNLK